MITGIYLLIQQYRLEFGLLEYDLITDEDIENLPEEPHERFVALDTICRRSLSRLISNESQVSFDNFARIQYMSYIAAAAEELGVQGIFYPKLMNPIEGFEEFVREVGAASMRIRLKSKSSKLYSVELSNITKARIEQEIGKLREIINNSDLSETKKEALLIKLGELSSHLYEKRRISLAKTMTILMFVSSGLMMTTSFLADAPQAMTTITSLIGADKEAEDAENRRLSGKVELKALPAPTPSAIADNSSVDDIPF